MLECLAIHELHNDEGLAIFFIDILDGADVRMTEGRSSLSFATEAFEC